MARRFQIIFPDPTVTQCSVQKFGGTRKIGPHRSHRFLKNSEKIDKIRENSAKMHRRHDRGTVKTEKTENRQIFFGKLAWRFPAEFCQKPGDFCRKSVNGTKNHENNDMTSTKFVHANSP
jgi:hypothetical protein